MLQQESPGGLYQKKQYACGGLLLFAMWRLQNVEKTAEFLVCVWSAGLILE